MDIVVNDTNIFIDLYSIDLLADFFELPFHIHTVDFVLSEITEQNQVEALAPFLSNGKLFVKKHSAPEVQQLYEFHLSCKGNVSIPDCAVWQYAQTNNYILLTSDRKLRNNAIATGVSVSGILFVFDKLIECNILSAKEAANKLENLARINNRLPKKEVSERILRWRK